MWLVLDKLLLHPFTLPAPLLPCTCLPACSPASFGNSYGAVDSAGPAVTRTDPYAWAQRLRDIPDEVGGCALCVLCAWGQRVALCTPFQCAPSSSLAAHRAACIVLGVNDCLAAAAAGCAG